MAEKLPPHMFALIKALGAADGAQELAALSSASGIDQALLSAAAVELETTGNVALDEQAYTELKLGTLGADIQAGEAVLPERLLARRVLAMGGSASIKELSTDSELKASGIQPGKFAKNLAQLGWASFEKGALTLSADAEPEPCGIETSMAAIQAAGGTLITAETTDPAVLAGATQFKGRKELIAVRERKRRILSLTAEGQEMYQRINAGELVELIEVNELTPEMLLAGSWREAEFRSYDVSLPAEKTTPGKPHPLMRIVEETRLAFLELGFTEASCPMAETAFWDFDALFQPQDHPAREMQDTFYVKHPAKYELPEAELVERVKRTHEDGWETGSRGWRYDWSSKRAAQVVLRTHMTASSIEAIKRNPNPPQKVFSIGKVFRREAVDHRHLPEFYQVDGIIIDEHGSFASLLGTMEAFLNRLGITEVRFKPDFFPYTEPSAGVEAKVGGRWLELAGSGIFRPEVTLPFGCTAPVLAWGFGLERIAMARYGIQSIKDLVQSDFDWLKDAPLEA